MSSQYPHLFTPLKVKDLTLKNRIISAPNMLFETVDGRPNDYYIGYLEHKARGGAAVVTLGEANVCDGGNHTPGMETTHDNRAIYGEMAAAIHEHGAIASVELTHGGMAANPLYNKNPAHIFGPTDFDNPFTGFRGHAMTKADIETVKLAYADTTEYYLAVGFDTVLVHVGHGWLLEQFLSPLRNTRTDEYGGSAENRMRFPLEVLESIRNRVGDKKALTIRLSGSERMPDGFTPADMADFLARAQEYVDLVEVSTEGFAYTFGGTYMQLGQNVPLADEIKNSGKVDIPVFVIGSINRPEQAEEIIASGKADGVSMSRALIADPYLPKKAKLGRADEITPCLRCSTCTGSDNLNRHFICSVNPLISREHRLGFGDLILPANKTKKVVVVGGGAAGITAAVTAAKRGHDVTLVERGEDLGGWLRFADKDSLKHDIKRYKDFLVRSAESCGAKIMFGTVATPALMEKLSPDHIIVASGSKPIVPTFIPGYENAMHATAAYFGDPGAIGDKVAIIGGGLIGVETGLHLKNLGKDVTVLEMLPEYASDAMMVYRWSVEMKVEELGLDIITSAKVTGITEDGVRFEKDGEERLAIADTVLYAVGMEKDDDIWFELQDSAPFVSIAGDAKKGGKIDGAVHSAYFAAMDIGDI